MFLDSKCFQCLKLSTPPIPAYSHDLGMVERIPGISLPDGVRTGVGALCRPCLREASHKRCENLFQENNLAVEGKEISGIGDGGKSRSPPCPKEGFKQYRHTVNYRHLQ